VIKSIIFSLVIFLISNQTFAEDINNQGAIVKILNKKTTKSYQLKTPLGQEIKLGKKELTIYQCISLDRKKGNDQIALIKFFSSKKNEDENFIGWIFKSSPSLVSLNDKVYDIKLQKCIFKDPLFHELIEIN
tara:strand:+ start:629 stop:1024 length:396 start_codon:yes stop_codon:yes gene_type:complete